MTKWQYVIKGFGMGTKLVTLGLVDYGVSLETDKIASEAFVMCVLK